jgi:hypothetical protein
MKAISKAYLNLISFWLARSDGKSTETVDNFVDNFDSRREGWPKQPISPVCLIRDH